MTFENYICDKGEPAMIGTKYLSDVLDVSQFQRGKINLIEIIMQSMIQCQGRIKKYAFAV